MRSVGIEVLNSRLSEYADLVRSGVLTPPLASSGPPPRPEPAAPLNEVLAELEENRRDR